MISEVVPGLWRVALGMVNAYIIEDAHGVTLIDCGTIADAPRLLALLNARQYSLSSIRFVLTHLHADHVGSAAILQQHGVSAALMHPLDAVDAVRGITMRNFTLVWPFALFQRVLDARPPAPGAAIHVVADAHDGIFLTPNLRVIHTPGHTAGHISLLWHAHGGVLIAGDACTNVIGLRAAVGHEDPIQALATRQRLGDYDYQHLVVGHGNPIITHANQRVKDAFQ